MSLAELGRSPTFVVGTEKQRGTLDALVKREQHFSEQFQKNKPLCFNAKAYQKTHPIKALKGQSDADATLCSPMCLGIADGVSQIEDFGIDASELPNELLNAVEELAVSQLLPGQETEEYSGPISMVRDAYEATECLGSTTLLTAVMDNSTKIHGKLHPMIAVCSIGDCEILIMRRGPDGRLAVVFHTEMQRIDGNAQSPLQLARVDDTIDPDFDESIAIEVIERGSAVHCVSAFEGDLVLMGSDGVFDNLFVDEVQSICEEMIYPTLVQGRKFQPIDRHVLGQIARRIVAECHAKTQPGPSGQYADAPIGKGGKIDDTSCVVAQVVEWTAAHGDAWAKIRSNRSWENFVTCGGNIPSRSDEFLVEEEDEEDEVGGYRARNYPAKPNANSFASSGYDGSFNLNNMQAAPQRQRRPVPQERGRDTGCSIM